MLSRAHQKLADGCQSAEDVFKRDGQTNAYSAQVVEGFNRSRKRDITLTELDAVYHGTTAEISQNRLGVIRENLQALFDYVLSNVRLPQPPTLRAGALEYARVNEILEHIRARIEENLLRAIKKPPAYSVQHIIDNEKGSLEARRVSKLLGPHALGCAARIQEQLRRLGSAEADEQRRSPQFLEKIWEQYSVEVSALNKELTDPKRAAEIKHAYETVFKKGKCLPQVVARKLELIHDPRTWVQMLYRELGVFVFVNLITSADAQREDVFYSTNSVVGLAKFKSQDAADEHRCVGRSLTLPIGVRLALADQMKLAQQASAAFGEPYVMLGKTGIVAGMQQALLTQKTLYEKTDVVLAATASGNSPGESFVMARARAGGILSRETTRFDRAQRGTIIVPRPRTLV